MDVTKAQAGELNGFECGLKGMGLKLEKNRMVLLIFGSDTLNTRRIICYMEARS